MNYKSVLEEQIRELQKIQDVNIKSGDSEKACKVAQTIDNLVAHAQNI